jgi:hypothetical protein
MLDELYGELDEFIPTRKRLARELKGAGHKETSGVLASARKPTVAAWVLNPCDTSASRPTLMRDIG